MRTNLYKILLQYRLGMDKNEICIQCYAGQNKQ
jgi:hypothetical protein